MSFTPRRRARDVIFWNSNNGEDGQVVSKKRSSEQGEVYTPKIVCDFMYKNYIDHHKEQYQHTIQTIDLHNFMCRVLEPCCGHGNFLESIIRTKIKSMFRYFRAGTGGNLEKFKPYGAYYLFITMQSLAGIDIMADNVRISRSRMFYFLNRVFKKIYGYYMPLSVARIFAYLLRMQIQHADTLLYDYVFLGVHFKPNFKFTYYFINNYIKDKESFWRYRGKNGWVDDAKNLKEFLHHLPTNI